MRVPMVVACCLVCFGAKAEEVAPPYSVERLRELLSASQGVPAIPEIGAADLAAIRERPAARALLEEAAKPAPPIPETTYTKYRLFKSTGDRRVYEKAYFDKRSRLATLALAAWLTENDKYLPEVNDLLWSICEETTWVLPAHESAMPGYIDLFAAETGSELAHLLALIGGRLPEEVAQRVRDEVRTRNLDPYLQHAEEYPWRIGRSNWTGVCSGSIGETFVLIEPDVERQAQALAPVLLQLERFKRGAFEEDGASLEGIGYWCYGLLHYVGLGEMLRARTGGAIDLLADPKMLAIAKYPAAVALDRHVFASFSDSHEHATIPLFEAARIAERTSVAALLTQADDGASWRLSTMLRNLIWAEGVPAGEPVVESAFLEKSGIAKVVGQASGARVVVAMKAGHNNEPHNHCDIGSFILRAGGTTFLCDPGAGLYTREYFGKNRYDNVFASSYGHSVPRIGKQLQKPGAEYRGTIEPAGENSYRIEMAGAYGIPELKRAQRTLTLQADGSVTMDVEYAFEGQGMEVEEAFVTWLPVEVEGNVARLQGENGVLSIRAESGTFALERLEEQCRANGIEDKVLSRITLTTAAGSELREQYTFGYGE